MYLQSHLQQSSGSKKLSSNIQESQPFGLEALFLPQTRRHPEGNPKNHRRNVKDCVCLITFDERFFVTLQLYNLIKKI